MKFRRIRKSRKIRIQPLCGEYPYWVPYLFFEEEDCASFLCMIYRLDVVRKVLLGKKCVCDIRYRGGKNGNILYFESYNGKWLKVYHNV